MDWNRIKAIFIFTFLVLDLFLFFQFLQKQNNNNLDIMAKVKVEDLLKANDITYVELPAESIKSPYITGKSREFQLEELESLKVRQRTELIGKTKLVSELKEPVHIPKSNRGYFFDEFLRTNVIDGVKYKYWKTDESRREIYFFQHYKGKSIFYNQQALLVVRFNEAGQIIEYEQTMLNDVSEISVRDKEQDVILAAQALEALYSNADIKPGSRITKVELGYYAVVIPYESSTQVIAPTWHFVINYMDGMISTTDHYFVNAMEGQVIKRDENNGQWSEVK